MISFDKKKTLKVLAPLVSKIISTKSILPISEFVLIEVSKAQDIMHLTCTDGNLTGTARVTLHQCAVENFKICISARLLLELLKSLPDGELTLYSKDNVAFLRWDSGESMLNTVDYNDFPSSYIISEPKGKGSVKISSLTASLKSVTGAVADESFGRPALSSILFDSQKGTLNLVASDSHQLVCASFPSNLPEGNFLLPAQGSALLNVVMPVSDDSIVRVTYNDSHARFDMEDFSITSTLVTARFPKYQNVIPENPSGILMIDHQRLLHVIKRASVFCDKATGSIRLSFSPGKLKINSENLGYGMNLKESVNCEYTGPEISMKVKADLLVDVLHSITAERIEIGVTEAVRPLRFRPEKPEKEGETQVAVLMPSGK